MIYKISNPDDTVVILRDSPTGFIVFDLEPEVDPNDIAIAVKKCTDCGAVTVFGLVDDDREYCDEDCCEGYLVGTYANLVIQGDKVVFALHRSP